MDIKAQFISLRFSETDEALLREIIAVSAENGMNTLVLEVEKAMRYDSHPEISSTWAFSKERMRGVVDFAKYAGLDVVPLLPTLSHCDYILDSHPELREGKRAGVYCPSNPRLHALLEELMLELLEVFEPAYFHIGHDELISSYNQSERRSVIECEKCLKKTPAEIFADDVIRLRNFLAANGVRTMMWADMLLDPREFRDAGFMRSGCYGGPPDDFHHARSRIPKDVILCDWHYELASEFPSLASLADSGCEVIGAGKAPINTILFKRYAESGVKHGLKGMMSTMWYHVSGKNRSELLEMAAINAKALNGGELPTHIQEWLNDAETRRERFLEPISAGPFEKIISFGNGFGTLPAVSWSEFRLVEYPNASEWITGEHLPNALNLKAGRYGEIAYEFKTIAHNTFKTAILAVDALSTAECEINVEIERDGKRTRVAAISADGESEVELTRFVSGRRCFRVCITARNNGEKILPVLKRLKLTGVS